MRYATCTLGRALAKKAHRYLANRSILSKVTTDGTTKLEVFCPDSWPDSTTSVKVVMERVLYECGAYAHEVESANIEYKKWRED